MSRLLHELAFYRLRFLSFLNLCLGCRWGWLDRKVRKMCCTWLTRDAEIHGMYFTVALPYDPEADRRLEECLARQPKLPVRKLPKV